MGELVCDGLSRDLSELRRGYAESRHHCLINEERNRQDRLFADVPDPNPYVQLAVLHAESGEVARALTKKEGAESLKAELVQVAAVAVAWLEAID